MRRRQLMVVMAAMGLAVVPMLPMPSVTAAQPALSPLFLTVAGTNGVPTDAAAVVLNVTVTGPTAPGYATVYPCGEAPPGSSNVNFAAGETIPNVVIAKVGTNGQVCLLGSAAADLIVDLAGFFPAGSDYTSMASPVRLVDSRLGTGTPKARLQPSVPLAVSVGGWAGIPSDASAVVMNVTAVDPIGAGYLTVFPCGQPVPTASNVNFAAHKTIPNMTMAKLGDGGQVCFVSNTSLDVLVDVAGYFPATASYKPIANPLRVLDTRLGVGAIRQPLAPTTGWLLPQRASGACPVTPRPSP